jgi:hypothetical protein
MLFIRPVHYSRRNKFGDYIGTTGEILVSPKKELDIRYDAIAYDPSRHEVRAPYNVALQILDGELYQDYPWFAKLSKATIIRDIDLPPKGTKNAEYYYNLYVEYKIFKYIWYIVLEQGWNGSEYISIYDKIWDNSPKASEYYCLSLLTWDGIENKEKIIRENITKFHPPQLYMIGYNVPSLREEVYKILSVKDFTYFQKADDLWGTDELRKEVKEMGESPFIPLMEWDE